jgi:hypothetical protein
VAVADEHRSDTDIPDTSAQRALVGDGAMGTQSHAADLTLDGFNDRRPRRRDEIRSAANRLTLVIKPLPTQIREPAPRGTATDERVGSSWASRRRVTT